MTPSQLAEARAERFVQPADAVQVGNGDPSTSPEALAVAREQGIDAWLRQYASANTGGTVA